MTLTPEMQKHLEEMDAFRARTGRGPDMQVQPDLSYLDLNRELKPIEWLVDGWVSKRDIVLLAGRAGGGKSTTAVDLAVAVAMRNGDGWMGGKVTNAPVIYLDEEAGPDEITRQFQRHSDKRLENLFVASSQRLQLDNPQHISLIENEIRDKQPGLVILDTATHFWRGANTNSAEEVASRFLPLFQLRDTYGTSFVILHHMRKPPGIGASDDPIDRVRGSGAFVDQASTVWTQARARNTNFVDLTVAKRRGGVSDRACRIERLETFDGHVKLIYGGEPERAETDLDHFSRTIKTIMSETNPGHRWTYQELLDECEKRGLGERNSKSAISHLASLGVLERPKRGIYVLSQGVTSSVQSVQQDWDF